MIIKYESIHFRRRQLISRHSPRHRHPSAFAFTAHQPSGSNAPGEPEVRLAGRYSTENARRVFAPSVADDEVLFHLRLTKSWLYQLILGLVLLCHSSYQRVVELFRDLFNTPISVGTVHNRLQSADEQVAEMDQSQDLAGIKVSLQDEIYQANRPVLVGVGESPNQLLTGHAEI